MASLSCAIQFGGQGTPNDPPTCSLNPSQVEVSSSGTATSTLTVSTTASTGSAVRRAGFYWVVGAVLLLGFAPRRRLLAGACVVFVAGTVGVMLGCGGNSANSVSTPPPVANGGTTTGLYHVVVIATSGKVISSTTLSLNVQ
jgi:hypothetical protein